MSPKARRLTTVVLKLPYLIIFYWPRLHDCCLDRDIISSRGFSEHHLTGQSISFWCLCAALQSPPPPLLLDYPVLLQVCTPASCCRSCFCICNIGKCFSHLARECLGTRSAHACMPARMRDAWVWVGTGRGSGFYQPRFDFPPRPCRHHPSRFNGRNWQPIAAVRNHIVYSVCSSSSLLAGSCRQMMMAGLADETKIPHSCTEYIVPYSLFVFESESVTLSLSWCFPQLVRKCHVSSVPLSRVSSVANAKRVFLNSVKPERS